MSPSMQLDLGKSLILSLSGFAIVFLALLILALAIIVFSKIFTALGIGEKAAVVKKAASNDVDDETCAVLVTAMTEELRQKRGNFTIKSIKKIS